MTAPDLSYIAEGLRPLAVSIDSLTPDPANARKHPERNVQGIVDSLRRSGQVKNIVVQRQGMIVRAGNGTIEAAKRLGWSHVAAVVVDQDDVAATLYALADNRSAELAEWDLPVLGTLLEALPDDLRSEAGFSEPELDLVLDGKDPFEIDVAEIDDDTPDPGSDDDAGVSGALTKTATKLEVCCPQCKHVFAVDTAKKPAGDATGDAPAPATGGA